MLTYHHFSGGSATSIEKLTQQVPLTCVLTRARTDIARLLVPPPDKADDDSAPDDTHHTIVEQVSDNVQPKKAKVGDDDKLFAFSGLSGLCKEPNRTLRFLQVPKRATHIFSSKYTQTSHTYKHTRSRVASSRKVLHICACMCPFNACM